MELHDGMDLDHQPLIDALSAAGNPPCWLATVLPCVEACNGSCGLPTWKKTDWGPAKDGCLAWEIGEHGCCGEADLLSVVNELIQSVEIAYSST